MRSHVVLTVATAAALLLCKSVLSAESDSKCDCPKDDPATHGRVENLIDKELSSTKKKMCRDYHCLKIAAGVPESGEFLPEDLHGPFSISHHSRGKARMRKLLWLCVPIFCASLD